MTGWMHALMRGGVGQLGWEWESFFHLFTPTKKKRSSRRMKRLSESLMKRAAALVYVTSDRCLHRCRTMSRCLVMTNMKYFKGGGGGGGGDLRLAGKHPKKSRHNSTFLAIETSAVVLTSLASYECVKRTALWDLPLPVRTISATPGHKFCQSLVFGMAYAPSLRVSLSV